MRRLSPAFGCVLCSFFLAACLAVQPAATPTSALPVEVTITVDGKSQTAYVPPRITVREALVQAGVTTGELDRITPPPYTLVGPGLTIAVVRVSEAFEVEQAPIPYSSEIVRNEGLPAGERRLLQAGSNGLEEITYRIVYEDGVQVARSIIKRVEVVPPVDEIIMVGSQASFTIVPITGTLAYINAGNAWVIRRNSGQRLPLTFTGDLDGRVFDLSPDGQRLLYTRRVTDSDSVFNSLWTITTTTSGGQPLDLQISNVLYAEWLNGEPRRFVYSNAEKTTHAPGWQANNNLWIAGWDEIIKGRRTEYVFTATMLLDSSSGGPYGWWGTGFALAPDGRAVAYARTDAVGIIDLQTAASTELIDFTAYNSHSDWAWYPRPAWSPDGIFIYTVIHGPPLGLEAAEDSPAFDLVALDVAGSLRAKLVPRAGMFANPVVSPATDGRPPRLAYLQAIEPNSSALSRYRLGIMDRDGSNLRFIFPPADQPGLMANQTVVWSPDGRLLAVIYAGNLWLVAADSGIAQQLTGDGLADRPDWAQ